MIYHNPDVVVHNHGSILVIQPCSEVAKGWVEENIPDDAQWWAGGFVCEPRFADDILFAMQAEGMTVAG